MHRSVCVDRSTLQTAAQMSHLKGKEQQKHRLDARKKKTEGLTPRLFVSFSLLFFKERLVVSQGGAAAAIKSPKKSLISLAHSVTGLWLLNLSRRS